jgi:hypothetical protein
MLLSCVGRGLCDRLITRPKESYQVSNEIKKPKNGGQGPAWGLKATDYFFISPIIKIVYTVPEIDQRSIIMPSVTCLDIMLI